MAELIVTVKHCALIDALPTSAPMDSTDASLMETALMYVEQNEFEKAQEYLNSMSILGIVRAVRNFSMLAALAADTWEAQHAPAVQSVRTKRNGT